jgi:sodium/potassium-transporting ATPase subunit alpha
VPDSAASPFPKSFPCQLQRYSLKMVEFKGDDGKGSHIQWNSVDVEAPDTRPRPALQRSNSNLSINSMHSRRGSIDPAAALPIQYRTVSYQIAESKEKDAAELKKAKDTAAKGMLRTTILSLYR